MADVSKAAVVADVDHPLSGVIQHPQRRFDPALVEIFNKGPVGDGLKHIAEVGLGKGRDLRRVLGGDVLRKVLVGEGDRFFHRGSRSSIPAALPGLLLAADTAL